MADPIKPVSHRKVTLLDYITAGLAHSGMFLLRLLPFAVASAMGGKLASTIGPILKPSKTARRNLAKTFPDKTEAEIEIILREVWDNMGRTVFEWPLMDKLLNDTNQNRVEVVGQDIIKDAVANGKPVLFFGAHLGNWEVPPVAISSLGQRVNSFYRAPNNPLLLNLFTQRKTLGELIPKGAPGAKRAFTLLKKGEHLGILVDQKLNDGIPIPFFDREAMTGTALAEFALRFESPIIPFRCIRLPGARFKVEFLAPLKFEKTSDRKTDVPVVMAQVNQMLESWIRAYPGQWLWLHNRWPN